MEKWFVTTKRADFYKWAEEFSISPVVARIIRNRDLEDEAAVDKFLHGTLKDCYSPWLLKDMDRAVEAILKAVEDQKFIRVIGDYDVDGICSSYILTRGLEFVGAHVDTAIPHRIHDGYGLSEHLIEVAAEDGVGLIVTCDNGIAAASQIALAATHSIDVVVTDHHEVPFMEEQGENGELQKKYLYPPALAVIDPKREDCSYPFPGICGAVVAYKVIQALLERVNALETGAELLEELVEFCALATVCDVMELADENRILVKEGLKRMKHSKNAGLRALMEANHIEPSGINAYHLGFVIGPCLNATGRLDTAVLALNLLKSRTKAEAATAAGELTALNASRKNLTAQGVDAAERYLQEHNMEADKVLIIFLPDVHESLAGIIAGRIREHYCKPVFVLTRGEEYVKGSGRSIENYDMYAAMSEVKDLFVKFGGHKMAAGLSMEEKYVERLRLELNARCSLTEEDFIPKVHIDVPLPLVHATMELAEELDILEPFGVGNPKPLFAQKNLRFLSAGKMGSTGNCARFRVRTPEGSTDELVLFSNLAEFEQVLTEKYGQESLTNLYLGRGDYDMSVVYQLGINQYRGRYSKQLIIRHFC